MSELLIFGGTTEGRELAEYCVKNCISADVSVATEYGASLLPKGVSILCGKLDATQMTALIIENRYRIVIDATHPYAIEATKNISLACKKAGVKYLRLIRKSAPINGKITRNMSELVSLLNSTDASILCTLGSKSLAELTKVSNYRERLWIRVLPTEEITKQCRALGYDDMKIIQEKGPFSVEQNIEHLRKSGAAVLVTKESGTTGGYSEKAEAARICGVELITLARPVEHGQSFEEIVKIIEMELKK